MKFRSSRSVATGAVVAALACSLGVAGCTSKAAAPSAPATAAKPSTKQPSPLPVDPSFEGSKAGAAADVKITECPKDEGRQTAKATVTNSAKDKRDYAIMIIWLKNGNGTPLGSGLETVRGLNPGETREISITAEVVSKADQCVPNVYAGTLQK